MRLAFAASSIGSNSYGRYQTMAKRETARVVKIVTPRPRTWKEYFASAPRLPADFPKRLRDRRAENVEPLR